MITKEEVFEVYNETGCSLMDCKKVLQIGFSSKEERNFYLAKIAWGKTFLDGKRDIHTFILKHPRYQNIPKQWIDKAKNFGL